MKPTKLKLDINDSTCLHCVWVDALRAKFPKYKGGTKDKDAKAFEDMTHSAIVIAGRICSMLENKEQQLEFFQHIIQASTINGVRDRVMQSMLGGAESVPMSIDELKAFLESLGQPKQ